ncbi:hypothetical protein HMPREF9072_01596 [Capnocytophaga sp. oral taxon 324 str. F0483]|nr:hypothetical protein HMPREF9072_01596 [Capnocytophaga sp. oral taxon 324 str. F0483]
MPLRGNPLKNKSFTKNYYLKLQLLVELTPATFVFFFPTI